MNQLELDALADNELPPLAVTLYVRCFSKNVDFDTGCVYVSYQGMSQSMEHRPPRGSTKPISRPTKNELRHAISQLEKAGLIKLHTKGSIAQNRAAKYLCLKAKASVRPNEEQHESNTGTTRRSNTTDPANLKALPKNVVNLRQSDEQHKPYKPKEDDDVYARASFEFDDEWVSLASMVGLSASHDQLSAWFTVWQQGESAHVYKSKSAHQQLWRKYCASIRANQVQQGGSNEVNQRNGATGGQYRNATAETLRRCRERAQAGIGVGDFDFSDEA